MNTKDFGYELPEELIAQDPLQNRSESRLMVMDRFTGCISHRHFYNILDYLHAGDCLVINETKVIPARLHGVKEQTGAHAEILLLKRQSLNEWECLVRPGKKLKPGAMLSFGDGSLRGEIIDTVDEGNRIIRFEYEGVFEEVLDKLGEMPIPPYITHQLKEKERYNTVYAKNEGSAAAPTAGLHWTRALLEEAERKGIVIAHVTLHVGLGTFRPVKADQVEDHHMHSEFYMIEASEAEKINRAHHEGHRVICTGTTSCRTLEAAAELDGTIPSGSGWTDIFIHPGYRFKCMDGLITNFHLPESTLIMLVAAFTGRRHILKAYEQAVQKRYRFFSFGDASFFADLKGDADLAPEADPNRQSERTGDTDERNDYNYTWLHGKRVEIKNGDICENQ